MMTLTLLPPELKAGDMTPDDWEAELASVSAGVCVHDIPQVGHVHIGAPLAKDQPTVPVHRFSGPGHNRPGTVRWCMPTADAALFLALLKKPVAGEGER